MLHTNVYTTNVALDLIDGYHETVAQVGTRTRNVDFHPCQAPMVIF